MYISGFRYVIYLLIFIIDVIIMVCYGRVWTYWIVDRYGRYRTFFFFCVFVSYWNKNFI